MAFDMEYRILETSEPHPDVKDKEMVTAFKVRHVPMWKQAHLTQIPRVYLEASEVLKPLVEEAPGESKFTTQDGVVISFAFQT
jgi:hypothetical protein